jgi:hypothetical protein
VFRDFAFLQATARDFSGKYTKRRIKNCNAYALDKDFSPNVRTSMHYYNTNRKSLGRDPKINALMGRVEDMKTILGRNLTLLLEREHKLDALMEKSEQTRRDSLVFKKRAIKLKNEVENRSFKLWCLIAGTLALFMYAIITSQCGFRFQNCGTD